MAEVFRIANDNDEAMYSDYSTIISRNVVSLTAELQLQYRYGQYPMTGRNEERQQQSQLHQQQKATLITVPENGWQQQ